MKKVKWGILGVSGHFIRRVLLPVQKADDCVIHGIASRDGEKARSAADNYGIPHHYGSYEELLDDRAIDAVYIPLPNHLHLEWIKKAADAGKHILCEKPLTLTAEEAREAVNYCARRDVKLMEAFMYHFHPQWVRVAELITIGAVGDIRQVRTVFNYTNTDPNNIRNQPDKGGGGLYDIGCYAVSTARHIFRRNPGRVISLVDRDPALGIDRLTSGILDFDTGHCVFSVSTQAFPAQEVIIDGAKGRIEVLLPFNTFEDVPAVVRITDKIGTREVNTGPADHYGLQFGAFSRAVRNDLPMPLQPEHAIQNMLVIDALFASEKSGAWETVKRM